VPSSVDRLRLLGSFLPPEPGAFRAEQKKKRGSRNSAREKSAGASPAKPAKAEMPERLDQHDHEGCGGRRRVMRVVHDLHQRSENRYYDAEHREPYAPVLRGRC